jgi:hypothetical protein
MLFSQCISNVIPAILHHNRLLLKCQMSNVKCQMSKVKCQNKEKPKMKRACYVSPPDVSDLMLKTRRDQSGLSSRGANTPELEYTCNQASLSGSSHYSLECSVDELRQLVAATGVLEDRCPLVSMDGNRRLCLSPVQLDQQLPVEDPPGPSFDSPDNTVLAEPELVSDGSGDVNRRSPYSSPRKDLLTSATGENHPLTQNNSIRLVAWRLSGIASKSKAFQSQWGTSSWKATGRPHGLHISPPSTYGEIGVFRGISIPCLAL